MQSSVICNSLCGVRVNIMEGRPLMVSGRKTTNRIRDTRHVQCRSKTHKRRSTFQCLSILNWLNVH